MLTIPQSEIQPIQVIKIDQQKKNNNILLGEENKGPLPSPYEQGSVPDKGYLTLKIERQAWKNGYPQFWGLPGTILQSLLFAVKSMSLNC